MPFACQPRTLRNKDALPTVQTSKQRCLSNRTHPVGTSLALTMLSRTLSPTFVVVAMGKQRVPTSARVPIFDAARLLRELHAQAATVNVSLEGQRAPAIVLARDQTLQRSRLAAASSLRAGCSSSAYMLMQ